MEFLRWDVLELCMYVGLHVVLMHISELSDTPYGCLLPQESIVVRLKNDILPAFWAVHG
jgi:hypothetical protein